MPPKKAAAKPPAYTPPTRDDDGNWLCNVIDNCSQAAITQAVLQCGGGCALAAQQFDVNLKQRRDELDQVDAREDAIKAVAATRAAQPHEAMDLLDTLELRALAERRKILGGEIEALDAERARVEDDHTHPVFACDKHKGRLPK